MILDNLSAHKTKLVEAFLDTHPNVTLHLHADLFASRPSAQGAAIALRPLLDGGVPGIDVFTPDAHPADGRVSLPRGVTGAVEAVNAGALWARDAGREHDAGRRGRRHLHAADQAHSAAAALLRTLGGDAANVATIDNPRNPATTTRTVTDTRSAPKLRVKRQSSNCFAPRVCVAHRPQVR